MRASLPERLHALGAHAKRFVVRGRKRQLVDRAWRIRHGKVLELHPEYARPCDPRVEERHRRLWQRLRKRVRPETLRICSNLSGRQCAEYVPEEIFAAEVEPALNRHEVGLFLENKNFYDRWFDAAVFPETVVRNVDGSFYDADFERLSPGEVHRLISRIEYPLVFKPAMDSGGGRGVDFLPDRESLERRMEGRRNFVVQRPIPEHPFFNRFNDHGLNTMKVCTYRSVVDNRVHCLNAALRIGREGSLDNETAGGLVRYVRPDGRLIDHAVDKYGTVLREHPDSGIDLTGEDRIPRLEEMKQLVTRLAEQVHLSRLVGFDVCFDADENWRVVEINLRSQSIRFAQYGGQPFFGGFTDEVIDYVAENPRWC